MDHVTLFQMADEIYRNLSVCRLVIQQYPSGFLMYVAMYKIDSNMLMHFAL